MKKIRIGISKEIDFKVKPYAKKKFIFNQIDKNNFFYDVILITSNSDIDYKIINKCKKSSIILIICMSRDPLERVPEWEEIASVSMAVQNMWLTATSLKIGAFWSTPPYIKNMKEHISLDFNEKCLGIFYLGYHDNFNITRIPDSIEKKIVTL